jgi:hypothetical protein
MPLFRVTVKKSATVKKRVFSEKGFVLQAESKRETRQAMDVLIANSEMTDWTFNYVDSDDHEESNEKYDVDVSTDDFLSPDDVDFKASEWLTAEVEE